MTDNAWFLVGMMIATPLIALPFAIVLATWNARCMATMVASVIRRTEARGTK